MYMLTVVEGNKIVNYSYGTLKMAKAEKEVHLRNKNYTCVIWNKAFPSGIETLKNMFKLHILGKLNFIEVMELNDKIESMENGLV